MTQGKSQLQLKNILQHITEGRQESKKAEIK
jgi:hypothetical protein